MEKLVGEYLNSIVGDNPTLTVLKKRTRFIRGINEYAYKNEYYVNGILVGSRTVGIMKISMNYGLYNRVRTLFGLDNSRTSQYFNQWLSTLPVNE